MFIEFASLFFFPIHFIWNLFCTFFYSAHFLFHSCTLLCNMYVSRKNVYVSFYFVETKPAATEFVRWRSTTVGALGVGHILMLWALAGTSTVAATPDISTAIVVAKRIPNSTPHHRYCSFFLIRSMEQYTYVHIYVGMHKYSPADTKPSPIPTTATMTRTTTNVEYYIGQ